jgi:hypothetical protein
MFRQELGQIGKSLGQQDRQVTSIDDSFSVSRSLLDEISKLGVHFRRAPSDVERLNGFMT